MFRRRATFERRSDTRRAGRLRWQWFAVGILLSVGLVGPLAQPVEAKTVSRSELERQVIDLTNEHRAKVGCGPLTADARLGEAARGHATDMARYNYFSHTDRFGGSPFDRIKAAGYSYRTAGENLAAGRWRPSEVVQQWLNSPGHRANIENCAFTQVGVGVAGNQSSAYRYYWTQELAAPTK